MILSYVRSSLWNLKGDFVVFFFQKDKSKDTFPCFTYHIHFFFLKKKFVSKNYIVKTSTSSINKEHTQNILPKRDTENCYLRFLSANRWQGFSCMESWRPFTSWPVIKFICEGTLHLLLPVAQWLWLPEQQFHWIWGFSERRIIYACNLSRRWVYLRLQLTYSCSYKSV